ncbi:FAD-binding protein [Saccharopolyspora indica]|uniref:FAD-binding protein n=1 Tax=Saccharopolyspora indica TaxID=1229659 RepID=UPI0022EB3FFC|nr:FAD-binding protein [Saccharopolyspora indica]MDA3645203.1 FAD-binding protein [Saccharopolyspora indica]
MHSRRKGQRQWQVVIVGAGNAGLCAGIAALQAGADSVAVLDAAPKEFRGGNSSLTRTMRFSWRDRSFLAGLMPDPGDARTAELPAGPAGYSDEDYLADWLRTAGDQVDTTLVESIIRRSTSAITWMRGFGHRWVPRPNPLPGDFPVVFDGGGEALQARNFAEFERLGGTVCYDSAVTEIEKVSGGRYLLRGSGPAFPVVCDALVLASGGFEGSARMRERHLGVQWRDVKLRGVPYNKGEPLEAAIALGADTAGNWQQTHTTPQGTALPDYMMPGRMRESHGLTRYAFPRGIVVNRDGRRFFDEAGDHSQLSYVSLGQRIMDQPGQVAFQVFDGKVVESGKLPQGYLSDPASVITRTVEEGARRLSIDAGNLAEEVRRLNSSDTDFLPVDRDDAERVPKRLDTPPFLFVPVVCGLTFTYGGLSVSTNAEVRGDGKPISGLYAAGVIVGGLYDKGYPGGTGLMAGAVLGRAAGTAAANHALKNGERVRELGRLA